ncbi:MAG: DMT family transporter, partial [Solirubrobacteraceae bacterium]
AAVRAIHVTTIAHLSEGRELDSRRLTLVQLTTAFVVFVAVGTLRGDGPGSVVSLLGDYDTKKVLLLVYLALVCTLFAFLVQLWAVRRTSPSRVSLLLGTEPLWAAVAGVSLGGDPVGILSVVGAILVLAGTTWGRRIDERRAAANPGEPPPPPVAPADLETATR